MYTGLYLSEDMAEFNPYRGNVFQSPVLNEDGTAAPKDSLGRMRYRNQTDAELANRENYRTADNRNFNDGDLKSRISGDIDWRNTENDRGTHDMYYNDGKGEITTLIDDEARVYKGGSWKDRAYWLNRVAGAIWIRSDPVTTSVSAVPWVMSGMLPAARKNKSIAEIVLKLLTQQKVVVAFIPAATFLFLISLWQRSKNYIPLSGVTG